MKYLGYIMSAGKNYGLIKKLKTVADSQVPTTEKAVSSVVQLCNFCAKFIHHFSNLTASLTNILRKSQPRKVTLTHGCLEAFETLNLRLISARYLILPEVCSDAMFIEDASASTMRIATVSWQDHGRGLQPLSYSARKLNPAERGKIYSTHDLEALTVCEAVNHWRCWLEGCS
jgi:hypothetical protein